MLLTFVVFAGYGMLAALVRNHVISRPKVLAWMRRTFAGASAALGARLALARRVGLKQGGWGMMKVLLLLTVLLTLPACQNAAYSSEEAYRRDHDRYMRTHEPKTGGPDL